MLTYKKDGGNNMKWNVLLNTITMLEYHHGANCPVVDVDKWYAKCCLNVSIDKYL